MDKPDAATVRRWAKAFFSLSPADMAKVGCQVLGHDWQECEEPSHRFCVRCGKIGGAGEVK